MVIAIIINVLEYLKSVGQLSDDTNNYVSLYAGQETNGVIIPKFLDFLTPKMEVIHFSETLVTVCRSTCLNIP
jgi:hypothetical protein